MLLWFLFVVRVAIRMEAMNFVHTDEDEGVWSRGELCECSKNGILGIDEG